MRIAVIRQRPSIGDCLLLSPLLREIKSKHKDAKITVITDPTYAAGALVRVFEGMKGVVDVVESIPAVEWTTEKNKQLEHVLRAGHGDIPLSVRKADKVFDCNAEFMMYEGREGNNVRQGIAEFWVRHFKLWYEGIDLRPHYEVSLPQQLLARDWERENNPTEVPMVGIVLRSGAQARDWNFEGKGRMLADWLYTSGYLPITFDPFQRLDSVYAKACVGKQIDFVAALIQRCKLVVTPDTGLLHLAEAVGVKTVALWGIIDPRFRVTGYNTIVIPKTSHGYCASNESHCQCPWKHQRWSCLRRLAYGEIKAGIEEGLRG